LKRLNNVQNCDCLYGLKEIDDGSIDCIITSPPYNVGEFHSEGKRYGTYANNDLPEEKYQEWQIEVLNECYRVLKNDGSMWYNHKPRFKNHIYIHPLEWILKTKFLLKQEIIWDRKGTPNHDPIRFFPQTERIYWLVKEKTTTIDNWRSLADIWQIPPTKKRERIGHPAIMEPKIVENILSVGDWNLIVDPFAGAGTTAIVALSMGCNFFGFEISPEYSAIANTRIHELFEVIA
jgi:modification methylase